MRNLANAIHMVAGHNIFFSHWEKERYARLWSNINCLEMIICHYVAP